MSEPTAIFVCLLGIAVSLFGLHHMTDNPVNAWKALGFVLLAALMFSIIANRFWPS